MERYLNIDNIRLALDDTENLPTAEDLQAMMGQAEKLMFMRRGEVSEELKTTGWFLHSVASSRKSLEVYTPARQKRAHQISAHIFDLVIEYGIENKQNLLSYIFAGQIGYLAGELTPNATALYRRSGISGDLDLVRDYDTIILELGVMFLALDRKKLFKIIPQLRLQAEQLLLSDSNSTYEVVLIIIDAIWYLLLYVSYGNEKNFNHSRELLESVVRPSDVKSNVNTRWVAAHLLDIGELLKRTSLWSVIPSEIPESAVKAMTLGSPPILSLWPPQLHLLDGDISASPLLLQTKRVLLSVPTSSGKTLLSQLFIASHLAQDGGGVCIVAPSHSLCREIKESLMSRLRFMNYNVTASLPDEFIDESELLSEVEIMTPERLNFLIRNDLRGVLERFSLFVIDEAHLIGDGSRGWGLESSLSILNMLTQNTRHRIILMSSALGRDGHIHHWIDADGGKKSFHSEWRGPRRLFALYSPEIDKTVPAEILPPKSSRSQEHKLLKLKGVVRLKIADADTVHKVTIREHVGSLYLATANNKKNTTMSTPQYKMLLPLIIGVAESGPVLVIETSRSSALLMAKALAESVDEIDMRANNVADFTELRLGSEHPLPKVLRKGVAYHHAALPADVQDAIEISIKEGAIKFIVATTTLAEGVNLPVRTVFISHTGGYRNGGEFEEFIKGPTLVNTIGRAGRAGKESEGWIILAGQYDQSKLERLINTSEEDLKINSELTTDAYLEALEEFEDQVAIGEDAIFTMPYSKVSNFISTVWSVLSSLESLNGQISLGDLNRYLESTLAWRQISSDAQHRWGRVSRLTLARYAATDEGIRSRWAKSGASIPTSKLIEEVSRSIFNQLLLGFLEDEEPLGLSDMIDLIFADDRLELLLNLPEAPSEGFRLYRNAPRTTAFEVDVKSLLSEWIGGGELSVLVANYLSDITDIEYAYESLGTYITSTFEHYLPWVVGMMIKWINEYEQELLEGRLLIDPNIAYYIKYGVDSRVAVKLMTGGVRSRRLANLLSTGYATASDEGFELESWLESLNTDLLHETYGVSVSEMIDFKNFLNPKESTFLSDLVSQDYSYLKMYGDLGLTEGLVEFVFKNTPSGHLSIFIQQETKVIEVPLKHHRNIEMLVDTGLPYSASVDTTDEFSTNFLIWITDFEDFRTES